MATRLAEIQPKRIGPSGRLECIFLFPSLHVRAEAAIANGASLWFHTTWRAITEAASYPYRLLSNLTLPQPRRWTEPSVQGSAQSGWQANPRPLR